jgi:uncharacterized protein YjiK
MSIGARGFGAVLIALLAATGCREFSERRKPMADHSELESRAARIDQELAKKTEIDYSKPIAQWVLPANLAEISGLAMTADNRLLAHDDELGLVSEIDYRRGIVLKQFRLGRRGVQQDFEGIATAGEAIFLLTSSGKIYEFREGANGDRVDYRIYDTELGRECEFEGFAYDPSINSLILACKNVGIKKLRDYVVLYRWKLVRSQDGARTSQLTIPLSSITEGHDWKDFHPSGLEVDPTSGDYVIVAA